MTDVPAPPRVCSNCTWGFLGLTGVFCTKFNEPVEEPVAVECPEFDPLAFPEVIVKVNGQVVSSTVEETETDDDLVAACDRWLKDRHVTLWGQHFEVISPRGRGEAAEWLAAQLTELSAYRLGERAERVEP